MSPSRRPRARSLDRRGRPGRLPPARAGVRPRCPRPRPTRWARPPRRGAPFPPSRRKVIFQFNQNVGGTAGAVRVYNAQGKEVDNLDVSHPNGNEHWMGVGLQSHLPAGTYTATYRVISADTHIVYGGLVFNIGHPGAAPRYTVAGLIGRNEAGRVTKIAFGARARLPVDRADDRGSAVHAGRAGARVGRPRRPRAALVRSLGCVLAARGPAARGGRRVGCAGEPARRPAPGSNGGRGVAVELAQSDGHRRHARKPLRVGVGAAGARSAAARGAAARRASRRPGPGAGPRVRRTR